MNEIGNSSRTNLGPNVLRCLGALAIIAQSIVVPLGANAQDRAIDPSVGQESFFTVSVKLDSDLVEYPTPVTGTASVSWPDGTIFVGGDIAATATQALPDATGSTVGAKQTPFPNIPPYAGPLTFNGTGTVSFSFSPSGPADVNVMATSTYTPGAIPTARATSIKVFRNISPADNFKDRSQTRWGVGELINLSVTSLPVSHEFDMGVANWDASGVAEIDNMGDDYGLIIAPETAATITVTLNVTDGKFKGKSWSTDRQVVTPQDVVFTPYLSNGKPVLYHVQNNMSAGFMANLQLLPKDVSFMLIEEAEQITPDVFMEATGCLQILNGTHPHHGGGWTDVSVGDAVNGCSISGEDVVLYSLGNNKPLGTDGTLSWSIPRWYRVKVKPFKADGYLYQAGILQLGTVDGAGFMTISKKGVSASFAYNDPDCPMNNLFK